MEFVRTPNGLANAHLFFSEDYLVYCESDPDKPLEMSADAGFWSKIFSRFGPQFTYKLQPKGGKPEVIKIAKSLSGKSAHRTICAMDQDFCDLKGEALADKFVVYTYGYSFENDICSGMSIFNALESSLPGPCDLTKLQLEFLQHREHYRKLLRWPVVSDQILSQLGFGLFDRNSASYKSVFDNKNANQLPKFSRFRAMARLQAVKSRVSGPAKDMNIDLDVWRRMLGHLCWWLNYRICCHMLSKCGHSGKLSEDSFLGLSIRFFVIELADPENTFTKHYSVGVTDALAAAA